MNPWFYVLWVFVGLGVLYAAARLISSAWFRSRREHLLELARLKYNGTIPPRTKLDSKGEEDG